MSHSFVTLSSTTKLGLGLPNKLMSTCELSKLGLDETKKEQWARVFLRGFSSSLVRVLSVRLKRNKPGNRVIVSSMGCIIVQLTYAKSVSANWASICARVQSAILDKIDGNQWWENGVFWLLRGFILDLGGRGFGVRFYSVQDCGY